MKLYKLIALSSIIIFFSVSCKPEKETLPEQPELNDYFALKVGRYFIYRLDSTIPREDAKKLIVRSYQVKDTIDAQFMDGDGNVSYRIRRFIRNLDGTGAWAGNATFYATINDKTPNGQAIEYVDNGLRFIKMKKPLRDGFTWPGNSYINTADDNLRYYDAWEYMYEAIDAPLTIGAKNYPASVTVLQQPDEGGKENTDDPSVKFDERNYSIEKYAKGTGLVFKEFIHWVFQRDPADAAIYYYTENSFGVKLTILEHN